MLLDESLRWGNGKAAGPSGVVPEIAKVALEARAVTRNWKIRL